MKKEHKLLKKYLSAYKDLDNENIGLRSEILGILVTSKPEQEKVNDIALVIRCFENERIQNIETKISHLQTTGGFKI